MVCVGVREQAHNSPPGMTAGLKTGFWRKNIFDLKKKNTDEKIRSKLVKNAIKVA